MESRKERYFDPTTRARTLYVYMYFLYTISSDRSTFVPARDRWIAVIQPGDTATGYSLSYTCPPRSHFHSPPSYRVNLDLDLYSSKSHVPYMEKFYRLKENNIILLISLRSNLQVILKPYTLALERLKNSVKIKSLPCIINFSGDIIITSFSARAKRGSQSL